MKTKILLLFLLILPTHGGCCLWNPDGHFLRVVLLIPDVSMGEFRVGGTNYGTLSYECCSEYKPVPRGLDLEVSFGDPETVIGVVSLDGLGTHHWTLEIRDTPRDISLRVMED